MADNSIVDGEYGDVIYTISTADLRRSYPFKDEPILKGFCEVYKTIINSIIIYITDALGKIINLNKVDTSFTCILKDNKTYNIMMKMRYNVNTGLYEYCDRLTGEGIFDIFTKVGSEVAKKAASEGAKKELEKAGTQALEAGMKGLGEKAGKYAGEKLFQKKAPIPNPHGDIIMKELTKDQEKNADFEARISRFIAGTGKK